MLTVGVAVHRLLGGHADAAVEIVVLVRPFPGRGETREEAPEIPQQQGFVFVDADRRGGVR